MRGVETRRRAADAAEREARATLGSARQEVAGLAAEGAALERFLAADEQGGDAPRSAPAVQAEGVEAALGAALGEDLQRPETSGADGVSGWAPQPEFDETQALPAGATPLLERVTAPKSLARRLSRTGLVDSRDGPRLQAALRPGQRLVSREGDLWRWDGLFLAAGDANAEAVRRVAARTRLEAIPRFASRRRRSRGKRRGPPSTLRRGGGARRPRS